MQRSCAATQSGKGGIHRRAPARQGRNPGTGETIDIAASRKLGFSPAKQVKDALIAYSKADDGKKVFSALFSWDGIQEISPSFYDDMKTAAALAGVDVQGLANATPKPAATTAAPSPSKSP